MHGAARHHGKAGFLSLLSYQPACVTIPAVIERKPKSFFSPRDPGAVRSRFRKILARVERQVEREFKQITKSKADVTASRLTLRAHR